MQVTNSRPWYANAIGPSRRTPSRVPEQSNVVYGRCALHTFVRSRPALPRISSFVPSTRTSAVSPSSLKISSVSTGVSALTSYIVAPGVHVTPSTDENSLMLMSPSAYAAL